MSVYSRKCWEIDQVLLRPIFSSVNKWKCRFPPIKFKHLYLGYQSRGTTTRRCPLRGAVVQAAQNRMVLPFTQFSSLVRSRVRTYLSYVTKWKWHKQRCRAAHGHRRRRRLANSRTIHRGYYYYDVTSGTHPTDRRYDPASRPARPIFLQQLRRTANFCPAYILVGIIFALCPATPISVAFNTKRDCFTLHFI